jgi:hypothetical protein
MMLSIRQKRGAQNRAVKSAAQACYYHGKLRQSRFARQTPKWARMNGAAHVKFQSQNTLEHFDFETLRSTFTAKMNFACASRAGGGASRSRRRSNFKVKLL